MAALLQCLAVIGLVVVVASVLGRAVLAWCPPPDRTLSEATVVGAAAIAVWFTTTGVVVAPGSRAGVGAFALATAGLVAVTAARRRSCLLPSARDLAGWAAGLAVALACLTPVLALVIQASSTSVVHLSSNHDAYFFTAVPDWLMQHPARGATGVTAAGPPSGDALAGSVWDYYEQHSLRVGAESITAAAARSTGADPLNVWLPVTLAFQVVLVVAARELAARLWRPGGWALAVAACVGTSAAALQAVVDQHTPSILAGALAVGLAAEILRGHREGAPAWSPVVVALLAGGVAATYGELLVLVALPVAVLVALDLWRAPGGARRWAAAAGWSLVLAPVAWYRTVRGATRSASPAGYRSAYEAGGELLASVRSATFGRTIAPVSWLETSTPTRLGLLAFVVALAVGLAATLARRTGRGWWAGLVAATVVGWWALGRSTTSGYPQERLVELSVPLLVLGAGAGWLALADRVAGRVAPRRTDARRRAVSAAVAGVGLVALAVPGAAAANRLADAPGRRVGSDFTATADWIADRDPSGAESLVWSEDYLTNLWTPYLLRHAPETGYLSVYRGYHQVTSFGDPAGRRWLLLDRTARANATLTSGSVVEANARFALVDLAVGPATLAIAPVHDGRWPAGSRTVTVTLDPTRCTTGPDQEPCR